MAAMAQQQRLPERMIAMREVIGGYYWEQIIEKGHMYVFVYFYQWTTCCTRTVMET
jgi:hypothetical protein